MTSNNMLLHVTQPVHTCEFTIPTKVCCYTCVIDESVQSMIYRGVCARSEVKTVAQVAHEPHHPCTYLLNLVPNRSSAWQDWSSYGVA